MISYTVALSMETLDSSGTFYAHCIRSTQENVHSIRVH